MTTIMNDILFKLNTNSTDCGAIVYLNEKARQEGFCEGMNIVVDSAQVYQKFPHLNIADGPFLEVAIGNVVAILDDE
jgi:hypothetical protein